MRALLTIVLITLTMSAAASTGSGQTQAPPKTSPVQTPPKPALKPVETVRGAATTLTVQATDGLGAPLGGVEVRMTGPTAREGRTGEDGSVRFQRVQPGSYRLRFERDGFVTLERDATVRSGQPLRVEVTMTAAPPPVPCPPCLEPAKPIEPEAAAKASGGPTGEPNTVAIPSFVELNFVGRAPRKDSRLGCVGSGTGTLVQLREAITEQVLDASDLWLYVVAGEGTLRVGEQEERLAAGTFSVVPRTIRHSVLPRGKNPLMLVVIETGKACEGI
jgi:hypothetical protein